MPDARTLLLVEDDATTRELLSLLLTHDGWQVTAVEDGAAALDHLASAIPDAILCDLQMPGLCGTPLAQAIRSRVSTLRVSTLTDKPVLLAMTATHLPATPQGYDALLIKPFQPADVEQLYASATRQSPVASSPGAQEANDSPVLDRAVLSNLRKTMPSERVVALLAFVANDASGRIERMRAAALAGDDLAFRTEAHALKGSCSMVGALRLKQLAARAEEAGIPEVVLTQSKPLAEFVHALDQIRLMLDTLSFGDT